MSPESTKLETETREEIDEKLIAAGWVIQDKKQLNLYESLGVAVREMDTDTGPADYMLFIDGKACCIIEAKREGKNLGGVAEQSQRYATSTLKHIQRAAANDEPLPFLYEATNYEIRFRDERDPKPRSRYVFHFHQPGTLKTKRLKKSDFDEFIELYKADERSKRKESKNNERWKAFTYDEIIARDKTNLDIFWLKDGSLEDTENLPAPEVLAQEIVEQLEAALQEFRCVEEVLAVTNA